MPRTSSAALVVAAIGPPRLEPPPELSAAASRIWREIVAAAPSGHFKPEDSHLLRAYACAVAAEQKIAGKMAKPRASARLLVEHGRAVRSVILLATRLRLGPRARSTKPRPSGSGRPVSAYETMELPQQTTPNDGNSGNRGGDRWTTARR